MRCHTEALGSRTCVHVHGGPRIRPSVCVRGGGCGEREGDGESGTRASERDDEGMSQSGIHLCVRARNVWFNAATLPRIQCARHLTLIWETIAPCGSLP